MRERGLFEVLADIERKLERIMGDTTALSTAVANLATEDSELLAAINTTLTDLAAEVAALQAAQSAGDQAAIDAATATVAQTVTDLTAAVAQTTAADPGPQPPPA